VTWSVSQIASGMPSAAETSHRTARHGRATPASGAPDAGTRRRGGCAQRRQQRQKAVSAGHVRAGQANARAPLAQQRRLTVGGRHGARLARFVGPRLRDWEARFERARRDNAGLRSHIAALVAEVQRLDRT